MTAHTCNPTCQRPLCVARRRIEELEAELDEIKSEENIQNVILQTENQRLREAAILADCVPILIERLKTLGEHETLAQWDRARALREEK